MVKYYYKLPNSLKMGKNSLKIVKIPDISLKMVKYCDKLPKIPKNGLKFPKNRLKSSKISPKLVKYCDKLLHKFLTITHST